MLFLVTLFLLQPPAEPMLELRASTAVLYPGQVASLNLIVTWPNNGLAVAPAGTQLLLPWIDEDLPEVAGVQKLEDWLAKNGASRPGGLTLHIGRHSVCLDPAKDSSLPHQFQLAWSFRSEVTRTGALTVPPAVLKLPNGRQVASQPVELRFRPLPLAAGPLPDWQLGVGRFTATSELNPATTAPGQEVDLRLTVQGDGDLAAVPTPPLARLPGWSLERFRLTRLPDEWNANRTARIFRYQLQAIHGGGKVTLPSLAFSYFDPVKESYQVQRLPGPTLEVTTATRTKDPTAVAPAPLRLTLSPEELRQLTSGTRSLVSWYWTAILVLPLLLLAWLHFHVHLFETQVGRRKRLLREGERAARRVWFSTEHQPDLHRVTQAVARFTETTASVLPELQATTRRELDMLLADLERQNYGPPPPPNPAAEVRLFRILKGERDSWR